MKEIKLHKTKDYQVGIRLDEVTYKKVEKLANENKVPVSTIVREIVVNFIDEVIIK